MINKINVLYVNHYGVFGGAQRSIIEMISNFPENSVSPFFISPDGTVTESFKKLGIPYLTVGGISKFDHTRMSYYKGVRWLILSREILFAIPTLLAFLKIKRNKQSFDLIHINELTCMLPLFLAKKILRKPVILHARAVFNKDPKSWRTQKLISIMNRYADVVVPIDETVSSSLSGVNNKTVIHNGFSRHSYLSTKSHGFSEKLNQIPRRKLNIGFIGAMDNNKGIFDLLLAIKMCHDKNMDVSLIIAGNGNATKHSVLSKLFNLRNFNKDLNGPVFEFIENNNLKDCIHLLGFSTNTNDFFKYIDVICFPSYYNATGRPVFEAAFFGKPSMVAIKDPLSDTFIENVTGIKLEAGNPTSIFDAIVQFYTAPVLIQKMGEEALQLAERNFDITKNAKSMYEVYKSLLVNESE